MFPEINLIEEIQQEAYTFNGKSFLYDFEKGDFVYKNGKLVLVDGIEALKVWIEKVIRTEKYRFNVHKNIDYGITIDDLIGSSFSNDFVESEIEREITEALLKNDYIVSLTDWEFSYEGSKVIISFVVNTQNENFDFGVVI